MESDNREKKQKIQVWNDADGGRLEKTKKSRWRVFCRGGENGNGDTRKQFRKLPIPGKIP